MGPRVGSLPGQPAMARHFGLMAGGSLLAIAAGSVVSSPAKAARMTVSTDTSISSSAGCVIWNGGSLTVTGGGVLQNSSGPGLAVSGTVGTLSSAGSITGSAAAISNAGNIDYLTNTGVIDSPSVGIDNLIGAAIYTLLNDTSGTISSIQNVRRYGPGDQQRDHLRHARRL